MTAREKKSENLTFGEKVIRFQETLTLPSNLPHGVAAIYPYANTTARELFRTFFSTFFNDTYDRVFIIGINPGRFGSGVTGIPFTDPVALRVHCNIRSELTERQELTSQFIYSCIEEWGGAQAFYRDFFLTAVSPVGFVKDGVNFNYYDSPEFLERIKPFVVQALKEQLAFGTRRTAIVLGMGKNHKVFAELNNTYSFFDTVLPLEHPRFVMQYRRKQLPEYVKKYTDTFARALAR